MINNQLLKKSIWGIRKIQESSESLFGMLKKKELYLPSLQQMTAEIRRQEFLSVRVLLKELLGEEKEILYTISGKPYLSDQSYHISITHTKGHVALILNKQFPVGIDIETISPRIRKIKSRFMSDAEESNLTGEQEDIHLLVHWSAKESIFKALGEENVEFKTQLHIHPFELEFDTWSTFSAHETRTEKAHSFLVHYLLNSEYVLTLCQLLK